jgi:hypothetical protein
LRALLIDWKVHLIEFDGRLCSAADEASLGTAREVMRKAKAWTSIVDDQQLRKQLTQAQITDAGEKAKNNKDGALKAVRTAWSHILYPVKSEIAGNPFELEHDPITARDRAAVPIVVYDKAKADGIALEKLGTERLWLALKPIWPEDRPHLPVSEVAEWFASYVYLPKLRDGVVLQTAIRDTVAKLDPTFGYADSFDEATCARFGFGNGLRFPNRQPEIKVLPVDPPMADMSIGVVTLKNRTISPVAQLFIDCAREVAKPLAKVKAKIGSDRGAF